MVLICLCYDVVWCEHACGVTYKERLNGLNTVYFRMTIRNETSLKQNGFRLTKFKQ